MTSAVGSGVGCGCDRMGVRDLRALSRSDFRVCDARAMLAWLLCAVPAGPGVAVAAGWDGSIPRPAALAGRGLADPACDGS